MTIKHSGYGENYFGYDRRKPIMFVDISDQSRKIICIEYSEVIEAFLESEGISHWIVEILELFG